MAGAPDRERLAQPRRPGEPWRRRREGPDLHRRDALGRRDPSRVRRRGHSSRHPRSDSAIADAGVVDPDPVADAARAACRSACRDADRQIPQGQLDRRDRAHLGTGEAADFTSREHVAPMILDLERIAPSSSGAKTSWMTTRPPAAGSRSRRAPRAHHRYGSGPRDWLGRTWRESGLVSAIAVVPPGTRWSRSS